MSELLQIVYASAPARNASGQQNLVFAVENVTGIEGALAEDSPIKVFTRGVYVLV